MNLVVFVFPNSLGLNLPFNFLNGSVISIRVWKIHTHKSGSFVQSNTLLFYVIFYLRFCYFLNKKKTHKGKIFQKFFCLYEMRENGKVYLKKLFFFLFVFWRNVLFHSKSTFRSMLSYKLSNFFYLLAIIHLY